MLERLREEAGKLLHDARQILSVADRETRALTAEESATYDALMADYDAKRAEIKRHERLAAAEADVASRGPVAGRAAMGDITADELRHRAAFWAYVRGGDFDRRDLVVGTNTQGGYVVPSDFRRQLIMALNEENVMRQYATVFETTSGTLSIPAVSTHGSATWLAENGTYTVSDETFGQVTLSAYKATTLIKVSEELLNDSAFPLEAFLATEFARRIAALEEAAFVDGDGSGKPTGIVGGSSLGKTASATNAITADELVDTYHALARPYRMKAVWLMHDSTIKAIRKLVTGVSGDKTYLWQPGLVAGEPDRLLGRPVVASSYMPTIATGAKVAVFGDLGYYYIGDRQAIGMQRLNEVYAVTGQVGFRIFKRTDGKLALASAAVHLKNA
jgi:HK97 family phage major capsid protein